MARTLTAMCRCLPRGTLIHRSVKIEDLRTPSLKIGTGKSLLGADPTGLIVVQNRGTGEYLAYSDETEDDVPVAKLTVKNGVITQLEVSDDRSDVGEVCTTLLKRACRDSDESNTVLVIAPQSIKGRVGRFVDAFGFRKNRGGFYERRPGAILPYSVMM